MILGAWITMEWAIFFSEVVALVVLFIVIRKLVFFLSERFLGKDDK